METHDREIHTHTHMRDVSKNITGAQVIECNVCWFDRADLPVAIPAGVQVIECNMCWFDRADLPVAIPAGAQVIECNVCWFDRADLPVVIL